MNKKPVTSKRVNRFLVQMARELYAQTNPPNKSEVARIMSRTLGRNINEKQVRLYLLYRLPNEVDEPSS